MSVERIETGVFYSFDVYYKTVPRDVCTDEKIVREYLESQNWFYGDPSGECFELDELIEETRMKKITSKDNPDRRVDENGKIHAKWKSAFATNGWMDHWCTNCGFTENTDVHVSLDWNYCPKCRAVMDLKD